MRSASDTLAVGDTAPAFTLPNQRGETVSLADGLAEGRALLSFHRGTW